MGKQLAFNGTLLEVSNKIQQRSDLSRQTNILKFFFFFLKGHLFLIFVMLQIKIIHIYLSMSRTIDCVFYNPVENSSCGHRKISVVSFKNLYSLVPPPPRNFHCQSVGEGGGVWIFSGRDSCSLHL